MVVAGGYSIREANPAEGRAAGRPAIGISTRPSLTVAQRLCERLGFHRAPELDWEFDPGEWLFAYRLELT